MNNVGINHRDPQPNVIHLVYAPLGTIIRTNSLNSQCYADGIQLYLSIKPEQWNQLPKLQACLKDIKTWINRNFLLLNSDETEVLILGPKHLRRHSSENVRNLGVIFDPRFVL